MKLQFDLATHRFHDTMFFQDKSHHLQVSFCKHIFRLAHKTLVTFLLQMNYLFPIRILQANLLHTLIESVNANDVSDMIVRGKIVMKDREVKTLDEEEILAKAKKYIPECF